MGKGFISGLFWGGLLAVLGLGAASLYLPLTNVSPQTGGAEIPAGSEFSRDNPDEDVVVPEEDPAIDATAASAPEVSEPDLLGEPDTEPSEKPEAIDLGTVALTTPEEEEETGALPLPEGEETGGELPDLNLAPATPQAPEEEIAPSFGASVLDSASLPDTPDIVTDETIAAPETANDGTLPELPELPVLPSEPEDAEPSPELLGLQEGGDSIDRAIPNPNSIGVPVSPLVEEDQSAAAATEALDPADIRPYARNAERFDDRNGAPLFSVILIDNGENALSEPDLAALSFPVTFAIPVTVPDAVDRIARYRTAGKEVLVIAPDTLSTADPDTVRSMLNTLAESYPSSLGILDTPSGDIARTQAVLNAMISELSDIGLGLVTYDQGLNTAARLATSRNVPNARIFRQLDAEAEAAAPIGRYLDRAAFKAGQDGAVVMIGHTYPNTIRALLTWALEARAGQVQMAPISAVMDLGAR